MLNSVDTYRTFFGESCQDLETYEVPSMPPVRNQGMLNLCTEFATITLLDKLFCNGVSCEQLYSTLGLVDQVYTGQIKEKGSKTVKQILKLIKQQKELSYESCQPFESLNHDVLISYEDGQKHEVFEDPYGGWTVIKNLYNHIQDGNLDPCDAFKNIARLLPELNHSFGGLLDGLSSEKFEIFFGNYLLAVCREQRTNLPNFDIKTFSSDTQGLIKKSKNLSEK